MSFAPAVLALRGGELAAYHGAEHISIGTYEHDEPRAREHERCGTHLVGPMLAATVVGNVIVSRLPRSVRPSARAAAAVGSIAVATEVFNWMTRHPDHPSRAPSRAPATSSSTASRPRSRRASSSRWRRPHSTPV